MYKMKDLFKFFGVVSLFALMSCQHSSQKNERRIKAVPRSAFLVVEAEEMGDAFANLSQNYLWKVIEKDENIDIVANQLKSVDNFLKKNRIFLDDNKILLSVHKTGANSFDYLVYLYSDDVDVELIEGLRKYRKESKKYDSASIEKYSLPGVSVPIFAVNYKGVLILSRNIILIENSIRQLNSGKSLMGNKNFKSLYNAINPKDDFNILIDISKLNVVDSWTSQKKLISWTSKFSDWVELDVSPEENEIFLSGIASTNDSLGHYVGVFKNLKPSKITVDELLPSATAFSVSFGIESFPKYYRSYSEFLRKHGKLKRLELAQKALKIDRSDLFDSWVDDQFLLASMKSNVSKINYNDLVLVKSREEALALEALEKVSDKSVIDFRSFAIRKFNKKDVFKTCFGEQFSSLKQPYYTVIDEVVVFSDNLKIVKDVISDHLDGRSLSNYNHFNDVKSDLSSRSNILFYFKNPDFVETLVGIFPNLKKVITSNIKELSKYKSGAVQFTYDGGIAFTNILLKESVKEESEVKPLWDIDFDAELYPEINTLYNHKTKKKEIAVQDKNNVLYLISTSGSILWKKQLDSKILGEIKQVDLYKNRKLQMVFNTEKYLYLIDRNGDKITGYPKKLPWSATAGVGVFDYSKIRDYRLLVPMGKHLVMYDGNGKKVDGFKKTKVSGLIDKSPQHFRVKNKDYIVVSTSKGHIYVLDRRGDDKFKISKTHALGRNNFYVSESSTLSKSSFVTTTENGELLNIFLNGVVDVTAIEGFDKNTYFEKEFGETISLTDDELKWSNKQSAGVYDVDGGEFSRPQLFKKGELSMIMFGSKAINKIFLFDSDMNLQKGFPIYGQFVGKPTDYYKNGNICFPVIVNQEKGNLKMYTIN